MKYVYTNNHKMNTLETTTQVKVEYCQYFLSSGVHPVFLIFKKFANSKFL